MEGTTIRVLLIEPDETDAHLIREALNQSRQNCTVLHVRRLSMALEQMVLSRFDIALLNVVLDDVQGLDAFVALSSHAPSLPIILLSDGSSEDMAVTAVRKGAQDYLRKDEISPALLLRSIRYAISRRHAEMEIEHQRDLYERMLSDAPLWVHAFDTEGRLVLWSNGAEAISGFTRESILGTRHFWEFLFPEQKDRHERYDEYKNALALGRDLDERIVTISSSEGRTLDVLMKGSVLRNARGNPCGMIFHVRNPGQHDANVPSDTDRVERFRILAELTSDYVYSARVNEDMSISTEWMEGAFESITSWTPDEILENPDAWLRLIHPEDIQVIENSGALALNTSPVMLEYRILRKDGTYVWLRDWIHPVIRDGCVVGILGAVRNITAERDVELQRRELNQQMSELIEAFPDFLLLVDRDGHFVLCNEQVANILGKTKDELLKQNVFAMLAPDIVDIRKEYLENVFHFGTPVAYNTTFRDIDFEVRIVPVYGQQGDILHAAVVGRNITAEREAERALSSEREKLFGIIRYSTDGILLKNEYGTIVEWSPGMQRITGVSADEARSKTWTEILRQLSSGGGVDDAAMNPATPESDDTWMAVHTAFAGDRRAGWILRTDGVKRYVEIQYFPIRLSDGTMMGGIARDTTDVKIAELDIKQRHRELNSFINIIPDAVYMKDTEGRYRIFNEALLALLGVTSEELAGRTDADIFPARTAEYLREIDTRIMEEGRIRRTQDRISFVDGREIVFETIKIPLLSDEGNVEGVVGVSRDITQSLRAEEALRHSEREHRELIAAIPDMIFLIDDQYRFVDYKSDERHALVMLPESFIGKHIHDVFDTELAERFISAINMMLASGECINIEYELGEPYFEAVHVFEARMALVGEQVMSLVRDITELKETERMLEEQNNLLMERNSELDTFTHSVAHDLKNPLSLIQGYAELIRDEGHKLSGDELREYSESIVFSARKMTSIINALLLLASVRKEHIQLERVEMEAIVRDALRRLRKTITEHKASITLPEHWPAVIGYASWIEEIWVNFISNAVKFGGPSCHVVIGAEADDSGNVRYWISDDGLGIPEDAVREIFKPFTRLSQVDVEGHGLGLSIVGRIIQKLGGTVEVQSAPGRGSTFTFILPKA